MELVKRIYWLYKKYPHQLLTEHLLAAQEIPLLTEHMLAAQEIPSATPNTA